MSDTKEEIERLRGVIAGWREHPELIADYLSWNNRFREYSPFNRLMIKAQRPDATYCASYGAWQKLGRQVKGKGTGIGVFVPYFRKREVERDGRIVEESYPSGYGIRHTFDVSNTEPIDPENDPYADLVAQVSIRGRDDSELRGFITDLAQRYGYSVLFLETGSTDAVRQRIFSTGESERVMVISGKSGVTASVCAIFGLLKISEWSAKGLRTNGRVMLHPSTEWEIPIPNTDYAEFDFTTGATAWAIADRFGVDTSGATQLFLKDTILSEGLDLSRELANVSKRLEVLDMISEGVPVDWAEALFQSESSDS